jgi:hypothetical protein
LTTDRCVCLRPVRFICRTEQLFAWLTARGAHMRKVDEELVGGPDRHPLHLGRGCLRVVYQHGARFAVLRPDRYVQGTTDSADEATAMIRAECEFVPRTG